jgi:hypothetical protein
LSLLRLNESDEGDDNDDEPKSIWAKPPPKAGRTSEVDDQFFRLSDMEAFLVDQDRMGGRTLGMLDDDDEDEEQVGTVRFHYIILF